MKDWIGEKGLQFLEPLSAWPEVRMAEPIPLPVNPPRTQSRLYHHPAPRTDWR